MISELRETQKQSDHVQHQQQIEVNGSHGYNSPPSSPIYAPTPGLLTHELIESCVDSFSTHMYPMMPIWTRDELQQLVQESVGSLEAYCLISALCAFILIQPGITTKINPGLDRPMDSVTDPQIGQALMNEAIRVRKGFDHVENPSVESIITSFFLFGSGFGLSRHNTAGHHLREATAQVLNLSMQDEQTYSFGDAIENSRKRRLFWLLFVTERLVLSCLLFPAAATCIHS